MSENKGPFDRVIIWIKQKLELLEEENQRYGTDDFASWINEYQSAIRVLENIDPVLIILRDCLGRESKKQSFHACRMAADLEEVIKLLESLPDEEGET